MIVNKYIAASKMEDTILFKIDRSIVKEVKGAQDGFQGCPELMRELRWKIQLDYETSLTPLICEHLY